MSRLISEPFTHNTGKEFIGPLRIINSLGNALAIAEVKLSKVAVKVLFAAMLIDALHAALENRIIAFDGIGVDDATHIFVSRMVDGLMHPIFVAKLIVGGQFIAHYKGFLSR